MKFFERFFKKSARESAPVLSTWERQALREPGTTTGELSAEMARQMQRDAMIDTALLVKRLGVMAAPWRIEMAEGVPQAVQKYWNRALPELEGGIAAVARQALDAYTEGWSVQELVLREEGGHWWPRAVRPKDPLRFGLQVDAFGRIEGLEFRDPEGQSRSLPLEKFLVYRYRMDADHPKGRSDLVSAQPHYQAKQDLLKQWNQHLRRFASPTVLARYAPGMSAEDGEALFRSLVKLDQSRAILYPEGFNVETVGGSTTGAGGYLEAIDFHNREIARSILGQTLTTDEGRRVGSLALGKVHLQVLLLQLNALRRELAEVITQQFLRRFTEWNFGPGPYPTMIFEDTATPAFWSSELA
jgi:phage gp29-like protein